MLEGVHLQVAALYLYSPDGAYVHSHLSASGQQVCLQPFTLLVGGIGPVSLYLANLRWGGDRRAPSK